MLLSEIHSRCQTLAQELQAPLADVVSMTLQRAGGVCARCLGSGYMQGQRCTLCSGGGGRASHVSVQEALTWLRAHPEAVGTFRDQADNKRQENILRREIWKRDHPDLWAVLLQLPKDSFSTSIYRAWEHGAVTSEQEAYLRSKQDCPDEGVSVEGQGVLTQAMHTRDKHGNSIFRVEFGTSGWKGRWDIPGGSPLIHPIQARRTDDFRFQGRVLWCRNRYVILAHPVEFEPVEVLSGTLF